MRWGKSTAIYTRDSLVHEHTDTWAHTCSEASRICKVTTAQEEGHVPWTLGNGAHHVTVNVFALQGAPGLAPLTGLPDLSGRGGLSPSRTSFVSSPCCSLA